MTPLLGRNEFRDVVFNAARRRREGEPEPVRDAEDVRVDGECGLLEGD